MAEINEKGYQSIRDFIQSSWTHIELRDSEGSPVIRLDVSDPRVSYTNEENEQTLELTISLTGSDEDISLPQEFAQSALFSDESQTESYSTEEFTPFTMESEPDELTVKHQIQVPVVE